jgi:hypothetical protein
LSRTPDPHTPREPPALRAKTKLEKPAKPVGRRQRPVEHCLEFGEPAGIHRQKRLVQKHVLRLAAGSFQHEIRPASAQPFGCLIDQVALPHLGADVYGNNFSRLRTCQWSNFIVQS